MQEKTEDAKLYVKRNIALIYFVLMSGLGWSAITIGAILWALNFFVFGCGVVALSIYGFIIYRW